MNALMTCRSTRLTMCGFVLVGWAAGCSNDAAPTAPTGVPSTSATLSRIRVDGPEQMSPGSDSRFTVWARFSDGTETDVTATAPLSEIGVGCDECDAPRILRIGERGAVQAIAPGEAGLRAVYTHEQQQAVDAHHRVLVLPDGTFKLSGTITETNSGQPVSHVEVLADSEAGRLQTYTSSSGSYSLYGVRGSTRVSMRSEYYEPLRHDLTVSDHQVVDLQAAPLIVHANEVHTLVIRAAADCGPVGTPLALPDAVRERRYLATISTAKDLRVFVRLSNARMVTFPRQGGGTGGDWFGGSRTPDGFVFWINGYANDGIDLLAYPDVLEQVSDSLFVSIGGQATVSGGSRITGPLDGTIAVYSEDLRPDSAGWWQPRQPIAACTSARHEITLTH